MAKQEQQRAAKAQGKVNKDSSHQLKKGGATARDNKESKQLPIPSAAVPASSAASIAKSLPKPTGESSKATLETLESVAASPLNLFLHLDPPRSAKSLNAKISKDQIHQSILRLALQYADFKIVGANARCVAMLEAFKEVSATTRSMRSSLMWAFLGNFILHCASRQIAGTAPSRTSVTANYSSCASQADGSQHGQCHSISEMGDSSNSAGHAR